MMPMTSWATYYYNCIILRWLLPYTSVPLQPLLTTITYPLLHPKCPLFSEKLTSLTMTRLSKFWDK